VRSSRSDRGPRPFRGGDAYSDFVALAAQGLNAEGLSDPNKFRGEGEIDRAKALEDYRAGLDGQPIDGRDPSHDSLSIA